MSLYVVDASVCVKWLVPEADSDIAMRLQDPMHDLHAPSLFDAEVANTIWKKLRRGELSAVKASSIVVQLPSVPVSRHADRPIIGSAFEIAAKAERTVYDSLYVALAERLGGKLVSADDRFINALASTRWAAFVTAFARRAIDPTGSQARPSAARGHRRLPEALGQSLRRATPEIPVPAGHEGKLKIAAAV